MKRFLNKSYPFDFGLRERLKMSGWTGLGIFLLVLFFEPFGIPKNNVDNYILILTGFGGISFLLQCLLHLTVPLGRISFRLGRYNLNILLLFELLIWILVTVAFSFYLRYVGRVSLSFLLVFRLALVAMIPAAVNMLIYEIHDLRLRIARAGKEGAIATSAAAVPKRPRSVEFISTAGSDRVKIELSNLILIRSAENYIEINYNDQKSARKVLLRNTLRSAEEMLSVHPGIVRCHRNSIVNLAYVEALEKSRGGFSLRLKGFPEEVMVSRQYLLQVRELLENQL